MPSLRVSKIEDGTVIDHIPAGNALKLLDLLDLDDNGDNVLSVIMNVDSRTLGSKDILKVENRVLDPGEMSAAAVFAPNATVNVIEDHDVVEKEPLEVPDHITGVLACPNPTCVTNTEEPVEPSFTVTARDPVELACDYCEDRFDHTALDLPRF